MYLVSANGLTMTDIKAIIRALDDYMAKEGKDSIAPPEANQCLARKRLLSDSKSRAGLPLRRLLRANKLPHAYKVGRYWVIPRSDR